jgi:hypothetical protein
MKPHETVTLIDLDGKPIKGLTDITVKNTNSLFAHIIEEPCSNSPNTYVIGVGWQIQLGNSTMFDDDLLPLLNYLNDQLTFIRNGMWETLAIYQATLGKYWEVPVMEYEQATVDYLNRHNICHIVRRLETKISMPYRINGKDFVGEQIVKNTDDDRCILVTPSVYIKHYHDVFSQLTPWKGE